MEILLKKLEKLASWIFSLARTIFIGSLIICFLVFTICCLIANAHEQRQVNIELSERLEDSQASEQKLEILVQEKEKSLQVYKVKLDARGLEKKELQQKLVKLDRETSKNISRQKDSINLWRQVAHKEMAEKKEWQQKFTVLKEEAIIVSEQLYVYKVKNASLNNENISLKTHNSKLTNEYSLQVKNSRDKITKDTNTFTLKNISTWLGIVLVIMITGMRITKPSETIGGGNKKKCNGNRYV